MLGIADAGLADFDDLPGDEFCDRVGAIAEIERFQRCFVRGDKPTNVFRRQRRVLKDSIDRHHTISRAASSRLLQPAAVDPFIDVLDHPVVAGTTRRRRLRLGGCVRLFVSIGHGEGPFSPHSENVNANGIGCKLLILL